MDEEPNQTSRGLLRTEEGADTVFTAVNGLVQAWDATDGRLAWEVRSNGKVKALEVSAGIEAEKDVLVLIEEDGMNAAIRRLVGDTGAILWEFTDRRYACCGFTRVL